MAHRPDKIDDDGPQAPPRLADDLSALYARDVPVPPLVDERVLAAAARRFAHRRRVRRTVRWLEVGAAAAAVVAIGMWLIDRPAPREPSAPPAVAARASAREDIDASGRVDILDAFALARRIEAHDAQNADWDINGDGAIDAADVDSIARAAVKIDRGT